MIKQITGYEPYRSRPPTKGACRAGPTSTTGLGTQNTASEAREACMGPDASTALAVKRRWGEKAGKRPRDNIITPDPGPHLHIQPTGPVHGTRTPGTGFLCKELKLPPWRIRLFQSRDWITHTRAGETNRIPAGHNHTSGAPQHITAAKKRHRWAMPFSDPPEGTAKQHFAQALIFHIKAKDRLQQQKITSRRSPLAGHNRQPINEHQKHMTN